MKNRNTFFTLGLIFGLFALPFAVFATKLTVDPNGNAANGTYSSFNSATQAANSGDTIYIKASAWNSNSGAQVNKRLIIIGEGYGLDAAQTKYAVINGLNLNTGSDSTEIYGVYANINVNNSITNLVIDRSDVYVTFASNLANTFSNVLIKNCVVRGLGLSLYYNNVNFQNLLISNCIFKSTSSLSIPSTSGSTILVTNCLFALNAGYFSFNATIANTTFTNNIVIFNSSGAVTTFPDNNNSISNNIFYNVGASSVPNPVGGTNTGGNNLFGQPTFLAGIFPMTGSWSNATFLSYTDFELAPSSIGNNAGTDGTDIGIFGGAFSWPVGFDFSSGRKYLLMPQIPFIERINVQNASVPQNGTLNVNVKARKAY